MKRIVLLASCILYLASVSLGQEAAKPKVKKNQFDLVNEIYAGYGIGSLLVITTSGETSYTRSSPGTFFIGYTRFLNPVIGIGFMGAYTSLTRTTTNSPNGLPKEFDNYYQAMARIQFNYLRRPSFAMYSGIAIGITYNTHQETNTANIISNSIKYYPAGQLSLLGFRIGRSGAFAGEFGIGTVSILSVGFSYKLGDQ